MTKSITTDDVIAFLTQVFNQFGYCLRITTDNGVQFSSSHFEEFLRRNGIRHARSSIYNPQSNGQIERVNKNFKKALSNFQREQVPLHNMQNAIDAYLLNYNNTPHDTTSSTPAELLFRYRPRTRLELAKSKPVASDDLLDKKEEVQKKLEKRADYANQRRRPDFKNRFKEGDWVQAKKGPIRRLVKCIGKYTFETSDGYTVNTRKLRLVHRPEMEYAEVTEPRYPVRERRTVQRYGIDD